MPSRRSSKESSHERHAKRPSDTAIDVMILAARRLTDESIPGRTIWDDCPQVVLCDRCRKKALLHSNPKEFPLNVTGEDIGCALPILWKNSEGVYMDNSVIVVCSTSLLLATGKPIRSVTDGTVKIARSWYRVEDA